MEIKIDYEELEQLIADKFVDGFNCGRDKGVSSVMEWLESGDELLVYLDKHGLIDEDLCEEHQTEAHAQWHRIEKAIEKRVAKRS